MSAIEGFHRITLHHTSRVCHLGRQKTAVFKHVNAFWDQTKWLQYHRWPSLNFKVGLSASWNLCYYLGCFEPRASWATVQCLLMLEHSYIVIAYQKMDFIAVENVESVFYLSYHEPSLYSPFAETFITCLYIDWNVASRQYDEFESRCDSLIVHTKRHFDVCVERVRSKSMEKNPYTCSYLYR